MAQFIGNNTLLGTPASAVGTSAKLLYGTTQQVVLSADQKLISANVGWGGKSANPTGVPNFEIGIYDVSGGNFTTAPLLYAINFTFNNADHSLPAHWISQSIDVDFSAHAGKTLAAGFAAPSGGNAFDVLLGTVSGANRKNDSGSVTTMPATMATGSITANQAWSVYFETEDIAAAASIDSVNGDDELIAAGENTAEVTGYDDGVNPIISGTVGSLALSDVSQTGSTVAFTIDSPVNNSYYPEPDAEHTLTLTDGTTPATFDAIMRFADYTSVVVASAVLGDEHYLGGWTTSEPQDDDRFVYDPLFWTVAADGSYTGATEGPSTIWLHWRASDSKIFAYQSTVSDGVIVSGGLSVTGLSVTGLSVRGLSVRGL